MKHHFKMLIPGFLLIFTGFLVSMLWAGTTGKISGRVVDAASGEPLPGVNVVIDATTLGAATDLNGDFVILMIPPGNYSVTATMIGYDPFRYQQVRVSIDKTRKLEYSLNEAILEAGGEVVVIAEKPMVQMDLTSSESVINSETIEMLPVENFDDIVNLQAGVVEGHFRGGRTGEVMYMVDGIPVNDVYSGKAAFQVENSSISELEVISGTFNAEYGQAMSGVVNIVTRDGGADYHGNITAYVGDYLSTHDDIFWNIDKINPSYNVQGTLHGPLLPRKGDKLTFFVSARYFDSEGFRYGKDVFSPSDQSDFSSGPTNTNSWLVSSHGTTYPYSDSLAQALIKNADAVPMNPNERLSVQGKLTWKPGTGGRVSYELFYEDDWHQNYVHEFRLNPCGIYNHNASGTKHNISYTHVFSSKTFGSVKFSHFEKKYEQYVNEDPFSTEYVTEQRLQDSGSNAFLTGGMQMWHFNRKTRTSLMMMDLTSQVNKYNQVRVGAEYKQHKLWLHEFKVIPELESRISPITTVSNNKYEQAPTELAAYLQDKIELNFMVMNIGLRFDYFDPGAGVPADFSNPETSELADAPATYQLSP
ncbi:carboxypeptidase regulatory-like domain-containing protein, partial [bacterium]|nr:carboxypeptidase regulatory-like domain-containing protein [bacterium]